jgi:hypothetical protein
MAAVFRRRKRNVRGFSAQTVNARGGSAEDSGRYNAHLPPRVKSLSSKSKTLKFLSNGDRVDQMIMSVSVPTDFSDEENFNLTQRSHGY